MKKLIPSLFASAILLVSSVACGPTNKCNPVCSSDSVCFADDGKTYTCKKLCTKDADCAQGLVCHTDENPAHCGAKE